MGRHDVGGGAEGVRGEGFSLGRDDLRALLPLGFRLAGHDPLHAVGQQEVLELDQGDDDAQSVVCSSRISRMLTLMRSVSDSVSSTDGGDAAPANEGKQSAEAAKKVAAKKTRVKKATATKKAAGPQTESTAAAEQRRDIEEIRRRLEEASTRRKRLVRSLEFTDDPGRRAGPRRGHPTVRAAGRG
jgi:hypothetical protein